MNGTKIYEASTKQKIAEIKEDNSVTVQIKKKREDKQLVAKKEGYQTTPFGLWNILFWPGFLVDLGTQKMNKWDNTIINIEMEKENTENKWSNYNFAWHSSPSTEGVAIRNHATYKEGIIHHKATQSFL